MSDRQQLHDILPEPQPVPASRPGRIAALWVGILALLAGGVFGAFYLAGEDEGTPEEAVQKMLDAIADEDVLGVLAALPPSERDPLRDNLPAMADELRRLEILSADFDLEKVRGIDLGFKDVEMTSTVIGEGVSSVRITKGVSSYRVVPRDLPLGQFVLDLFGDDLPAEPETGSEPVTSDDPVDDIVTIKEGGRWYVSLNYSIAEVARRESGAAAPAFGQGLHARGGASPEAAVEALLRAGASLDLRRVLELLPPDEARVLHDYAPLFLDDAQTGAEQLGFRAEWKTIDLSAERDGDHASVTIDALALSFEVEGERVEVSYDGTCVQIAAPDVPREQSRLCPDDQEVPEAFAFATRMPAQGFVVVERGGEWYVSPTRTLLESLVGGLKALQREDLEGIRQFFEGTSEA
jgi:hypothetical protein